MKTILTRWLPVLLCACYHGTLAAPKVCKMSNTQGMVQTFFSTIQKVNTFPCGYKLVDLKCGKTQAVVTAVNGQNKGKLYVREVSVVLTYINSFGIRVTQTNHVSKPGIKTFVAKGNMDKPLWTWSSTGQTPTEAERIYGYWDRKLRTAYLVNGDLRVDFEPSKDKVTIACEESAIGGAKKFPYTLCGSPSNTMSDVTALDSFLPHNETLNMTLTRLDFAQLARQDVEQARAVCQEASDAVSGRCADRGDVLYTCNMFYSPYQVAMYGKCMRAAGIDAFRAYVTCVRLLCAGKKDVPASNDCRILKKVYKACGDLKKAPVKVSELQLMSRCVAE
ncbi:uncharacterized protein [Littorina saxatilis]|uniref:Uncharacterized protein n=1 Tax=Littorina saxatilis TaxID=31220 RepID=A0AAN9GGK4_9CAEN